MAGFLESMPPTALAELLMRTQIPNKQKPMPPVHVGKYPNMPGQEQSVSIPNPNGGLPQQEKMRLLSKALQVKR